MRVPSSTPAGILTDKRALARDAALAAAMRAGIGNDLAAALAGRAGALDGEEALGRPHRARLRRRWCRSWARCRAWHRSLEQMIASDRSWHADLRGLAGESLGQADFHIVAQISSRARRRRAVRRQHWPPRPRPPPMNSPNRSSKISDIEEVNSGPKPGRRRARRPCHVQRPDGRSDHRRRAFAGPSGRHRLR